MVRHEELFTLEELKRAGGRLQANTAPGIDGFPNEILKEVSWVYPEILLEVFNSCLRDGRFFADWKKQRLVLLRKGNKPLGDASSHRPICLLDTMGKLLEEMIQQSHMVRENGLSENQFGFRKGRSTVDAIQAVVDIDTKGRRGTGKNKGFLRMDLPAGTSIIGFADDALVVFAADNVGILELRINDTLWRAKRWLDSRGLKLAPEKTKALLVTDRRSFQYPNIAFREHEIE